MSIADELVEEFRQPKSESEKNLDFERSTLHLVLAQLGSTKAQSRAWEKKLGPAFNFDWFNSLGVLPLRLFSQRVFRFDFKDLLFRPTKSAVVDAWLKGPQDGQVDSVDEPLCMIFKVFELGRMVATAMPLPDVSHLHIKVRSTSFNVAPCQSFFKDKYGDLITNALALE